MHTYTHKAIVLPGAQTQTVEIQKSTEENGSRFNHAFSNGILPTATGANSHYLDQDFVNGIFHLSQETNGSRLTQTFSNGVLEASPQTNGSRSEQDQVHDRSNVVKMCNVHELYKDVTEGAKLTDITLKVLVCICVYVYMCVCVYICVLIFLCMRVCTCACKYT
jgi:hypothetical protein